MPDNITVRDGGLTSTVMRTTESGVAHYPHHILAPGATVQLIGPALVSPVQFGLSSTVVGQTTPALSVPVVLAANQVLGSVQVSGGTVGLVAGTAQVGSVDVRATGLSSVTVSAGTAIMGSVNVGGSVAVLSLLTAQATQIQFGLSAGILSQ